MPAPIFKNSVMLKDLDNPLAWALEVHISEDGDYVGFVTHKNGVAVKPFPAIGRREARRLLRLLQEALDA